MTFADLGERVARAPRSTKVATLFFAMGAVCALFYLLFYSELQDESNALDGEIARLKEEKASYEDKKQKYMAFRAEVNKLLDEQKELVKILPTEAEISSFLQSIHAQAELIGLNIMTFDQQPEQKFDFYAKIPVRMTINGTYHQISKFFNSIGALKRIVNVQDLILGTPQKADAGIQLTAFFVASTFRFLEAAASPAAAPKG